MPQSVNTLFISHSQAQMLSPLFEHIEQKCNLEPIKELLRAIKGRNPKANQDVVLGATKAEAVRNLQQAVALGHAQPSEVHDLLRRSEEAGHQHVLLLCPAPDPDGPDNMDGEAVFAKLFNSIPPGFFPRFEYPSNGYAWSDFRYNAGSGSWLAKAYGREVVKASVGLTTEDLGDGRIQEIREYEYRDVKTLLVAKWNAEPNILEMRIDVSGIQNNQTLPDRRNAFWKLFESAFGRNNFVGLDIDQLLHTLVFDREKPENQQAYTISRVELTDPRSGLIRVLPFQSEEFDKDEGRKKALSAMESSNFRPSSVRIDWKPVTDIFPSVMKDPLATIVEKTENGPEVRILKKVPSEVYDYVFGELRKRLA